MICTIPDCTKTAHARGWCKMHYDRWARHGDPLTCLKILSPRGAPTAWLIAHQNYDGDGCLQWPFARLPDGRGHINKKGSTVYPSRMMCEMVNGPPPTPDHEAAHSCGNGHQACVHPKHVRWATKEENDADKILHGTLPRGEQLPQSKLTEKDVMAIRDMLKTKQGKEVAALFSVNQSCISKIKHGLRWRHV